MIDPKLIEIAEELIALAKNYSEPKEIKINPEPIKECVHEPMKTNQIISRPFAGIKEENIIIPFCSKCGVNLKAEKWVEA